MSHALAARPSRDIGEPSRHKAGGRGAFQGIGRMSASTSPNKRVAVIGLGSMGYGMAISLKRAGFAVTGCDVSADAVARFVAEGGKGGKTPAEAAKTADIVVSVVVNAAQTETILFGKDGAAETLAKDAVFVSSATMDPD